MLTDRIGAVADIPTFASLHHRNYRMLWIGNLISQSGDWMDLVAFNWLVMELTNSPFLLGMVNLSRAIPQILFTVLGGVAADRVERRRLMMTTQTIAMILALLLAGLVSTGLIQVWQVFAIAIMRGIMMSFNLPARQTLITDLVPRKNIANAIALNTAVSNLTRVIGPASGGILIALLGVAGCFYVNGLSFLGVLWTLHVMEIPPGDDRAREGSFRESLLAGFEYIRSQRVILLLVVIALVPQFLGMPYMTMLTVFARDELAIGPTGLGIMSSAAGVGAIIGSLTIASLPRKAPKGMIMLCAIVAFGTALMLFSYSYWVPASVLLILIVGAVQTTYGASNNSLLQTAVRDDVRGRVMSTLFLQRGLSPLGTALAGSLTVILGVRLTMASMAAILVLVGGTALLKAPSLRRLI